DRTSGPQDASIRNDVVLIAHRTRRGELNLDFHVAPGRGTFVALVRIAKASLSLAVYPFLELRQATVARRWYPGNGDIRIWRRKRYRPRGIPATVGLSRDDRAVQRARSGQRACFWPYRSAP